MDKQQARKIIKDAFESCFDRERYIHFLRELLNSFDDEGARVNQGARIPEKFQDHVEKIERVGKYTEENIEIMLFIVYLKRETAIERARTMQRNFVAWYLSQGEKDAALVAYVSPDLEDWRFSLVKMDYRFEKTQTRKMKVKEEFTPARRWSFLVGEHEKSHTAQSRLVNILANDEQSPTFAELENAFDIETVTKEFFREYRDLFLRTREALDKVVEKDRKIKADFEAKGVDTVNFAKKLLGQIVFLYFLQKKGWFGVGRDDDWGTGLKHFLRSLFDKKHGGYTNFFNDILEPLFYEALRIDRKHDDDYYSRFNCKIPFLNGGLFDPIGNYDWVHTDINLPNDLFSNSRKTKEGDEGDGILDVFDRYNFTVREDEPLEKEVAIDPELLGKAYEKFNAIRPDNFDEFTRALKSGKKGEENKFNKKFGVYYTPREIVHYMCKQSLIQYLGSALDNHKEPVFTEPASQLILFGDKKPKQRLLAMDSDKPVVSLQDIEDLIEVGEMITEHEATALIKEEKIKDGSQKSTEYTALLPGSIRKHAKLIDDLLADITVCDPAVGSGAFPVGMMNEIVRARNVLSVFLNDHKRNDYGFKRRCIEHSLYGVDIDPGAVEIAKLRLWLSLVVEEEDIRNIKPLPNLDYRIMQGNSLISEFMGINFDAEQNEGGENQLSIIIDNTEELIERFQRKKDEFLNESNVSRKAALKEEVENLLVEIFESKLKTQKSEYFNMLKNIENKYSVLPNDSLRQEIINQEREKLYKEFGFNLEAAEKQLKEFTSGRQIKPFFLWNLYFSEVFHNKGGFDVVIANPPYIRAEDLGDLKAYLKAAYKVFASGGDIFSYFYERAFNILTKQGIFCFINNAFDRTSAGKTLREYISDNFLLIKYIDFKSVSVFKGTSTYPIIILARKSKPEETFTYLKVTESLFSSFDLAEMLSSFLTLPNSALKRPSWSFDHQGQIELSEKIAKHKKTREIFGKCYYGIKTALNVAFITDKNLGDCKHLKPVFEGKDIKKWLTPTIDKTMIVFENKSTRQYFNGQNEAKAFEAMKAAFPAIMNHLEPFAEAAQKRYDKGGYWWELRNCAYYDLFKKPKIIFPNLQNCNKFAYDISGAYINAPAVFLPTDAKWFLAFLNSKTVWYFLKTICVVRSGGFIEVKPQYFEQIPIPNINNTDTKQLDFLVEQILAEKQKDINVDTSAIESEIDQMVYELYGLNEDEIKIVEGETK